MIDYNLLKQKIDIIDLMEDKLKIEGEIQGEEYFAICPFDDHEDTAPSFSIKLTGEMKGVYYCFGCKSKGHIIHLVQRVCNLSRDEAEELLKAWYNLSTLIYTPSIQEIKKLLEQKSENNIEEDMVCIPLPRVNLSQKNMILRHLVDKRNYTEETAWKIIKYFQIEYAQTGHYEGRAIIPIHDSQGSQICFEASAVVEGLSRKKLYPKGSPMGRMLFNNFRIQKNYCWIVEGIWDAIKLWSFGEPVISTFGAKISKYQLRMILFKYETVFLMFDGDEAGKVGMYGKGEKVQGAKGMLSPYINVITVDLQYGDPDELTKGDFQEIVRRLK